MYETPQSSVSPFDSLFRLYSRPSIWKTTTSPSPTTLLNSRRGLWGTFKTKGLLRESNRPYPCKRRNYSDYVTGNFHAMIFYPLCFSLSSSPMYLFMLDPPHGDGLHSTVSTSMQTLFTRFFSNFGRLTHAWYMTHWMSSISRSDILFGSVSLNLSCHQ